MRSFSTIHSPPPSPQPTPHPLSSSSSVTCCPELDLSVTHSPITKAGHPQPKPRSLKQSQQTVKSQMKPQLHGQSRRKRNAQVCFKEPLVVTVTPEPHIAPRRSAPLQQPMRGQRRSQTRHAPRHTVELPVAICSSGPGCLEKAELNTTLALKVELQSLQGAQFDSQRAVQETLQRSERTKNLINARATEVVNVSRSQHLFNSLVSVDVQEHQLISQVLQEKLHLAPPPRSQESQAAEGPTLNFFLTSDLLRQKPLPPEEEPVSCKPSPSPCPVYSTFDLYRRQMCWEVTP
ncbi:protein phosphatase 1 regulatory subunit 35 [Parambassis ranga]|uniref:Protein phosphatase 1 regulatory subunit 35 n=1 Tax=Parambassis ranga TaxID=210632 RepID=A0A6P7IRB5_9TELE|nr:protein phosphatase 1 regulatory subunit 35-like [Parambassis ranga]